MCCSRSTTLRCMTRQDSSWRQRSTRHPPGETKRFPRWWNAEQSQTFGDNACHPERMSRSPEPFALLKGKLREGEGSGSTGAEILRCAQDDSQDTTQVCSREVLSSNVCPLDVSPTPGRVNKV